MKVEPDPLNLSRFMNSINPIVGKYQKGFAWVQVEIRFKGGRA